MLIRHPSSGAVSIVAVSVVAAAADVVVIVIAFIELEVQHWLQRSEHVAQLRKPASRRP